jgi:hypothetical protein
MGFSPGSPVLHAIALGRDRRMASFAACIHASYMLYVSYVFHVSYVIPSSNAEGLP